MVEIFDMLSDRWVAIELTILVEAQRNFELCGMFALAENVLKLLLVRIQHLDQVGRQISRDELY